jgi:hypothetical protein
MRLGEPAKHLVDAAPDVLPSAAIVASSASSMTRTSRRCNIASRSGSCRTAWSTVSAVWICDPANGQTLRSVGLSARSQMALCSAM